MESPKEIHSAVEAEAARHSRSLGLRDFGILAAVGAVLAAVLVVANVPEHVSIEPNGSSLLLPEPGYTWVAPNDSFNWQVQWTPGILSSTLPNVLAAPEEGSWRPAPGYTWADEAIRRETKWVPNSREEEFPYVAAGEMPDSWILDPGYVAASDWSALTPRAIWKQGIKDSRFPHIESASEENHWKIDLGYAFTASASNTAPRVAWKPGLRRSDSPHVFASETEGQWQVDEGYSWLSRAPGDFRVFKPARLIDVWNEMIAADTFVNQLNCSSVEAIQAAIGAARARYGSINFSEAHPSIESHIRDTYSTLLSSEEAIQNCQTVDEVGEFVGGVYTLACLFADDPDECLRKKNMLSAGGGAVVSLACREAGRNARGEFDRITRERQKLQGVLEPTYGLRLPVTSLVACR